MASLALHNPSGCIEKAAMVAWSPVVGRERRHGHDSLLSYTSEITESKRRNSSLIWRVELQDGHRMPRIAYCQRSRESTRGSISVSSSSRRLRRGSVTEVHKLPERTNAASRSRGLSDDDLFFLHVQTCRREKSHCRKMDSLFATFPERGIYVPRYASRPRYDRCTVAIPTERRVSCRSQQQSNTGLPFHHKIAAKLPILVRSILGNNIPSAVHQRLGLQKKKTTATNNDIRAKSNSNSNSNSNAEENPDLQVRNDLVRNENLRRWSGSLSRFKIRHEERVWTVPWSGYTILKVMVLWFAAFWLVGSWIIPMAAEAVGFNRASLTYRGQALYSLITDIAEMTIGLGILHRCLARFRPLPGEWFPIKLRGNWVLEALAGCLLFPVVNMLSQLNLNLLPVAGAVPSTLNLDQSLTSKDPIATLLYVLVVSVCAPIWEEVIFRGFLLPSLTRYLPVWASVAVSALAFALAHFNMQRLLPLLFLGMVMGVVFVHSRNLLASMLLHSLWNGFVFLELLR